MKIGSLQSRIIIFFVLLMLGVQLGGLALINTVGVAHSHAIISDELVTGERIFNRLLDQNSQQLAQGARILSSDYAFREALASKDLEALVSTLKSHGARINAQVMMLVGLDKTVMADTLVEGRNERKFSLPHLIDVAEKKGKVSAMVLLNGHLHQLVVVPVRAPLPIAWVAMGFAVDDKEVRDLQRLTGLDVSFLSRAGKKPWQLHATTLPNEIKGELETGLSDGLFDQAAISTMPAGDDQYITLISKQPGYGADDAVIAVLQQSLGQALKPFNHLQSQLLGFSLLGIMISIFGSIAIARSIAGPVQQLASFARRIATGDYSNPPKISRGDEIGDLSSAFEHMRESIAARESKIMDLAYRDTLTNLPNRALFTDHLDLALSTSRRLHESLSILIMDIDHFKYVNDTLGHHMGDLLLCEVANRLRSIVHTQSNTVARLGGDEFAILLPGADIDKAREMVRRVLQALEAPMMLEGHVVDMRASIGLVTCPQHGDELQCLLRRADLAMYLAKRNNTGFAIYDASSDQHSAERLSLMSQLRKAVEEDELVLYYQPKISLIDPRESYVEALVRWQHPQRGFIPPFEFIPFAEQTGYIKAITLWVLNQAVAQCAQWRQEGLPINVSINISARDLMNPELPVRFVEILTKHNCKAEWLSLEITESGILDDPGHALNNLNRLHALGCKLSIDDYGIGYSSLSYLKRLPVDELKIDRSFVMGMVNDHDDAVIVRSTIDLAHNIGLQVVAEGVENQEILDLLREMGCDMAQGYLMSKAIPAVDLAVWVRESPWTTIFCTSASGASD